MKAIRIIFNEFTECVVDEIDGPLRFIVDVSNEQVLEWKRLINSEDIIDFSLEVVVFVGQKNKRLFANGMTAFLGWNASETIKELTRKKRARLT